MIVATKSRSPKVAKTRRLSPLARWILQHAGTDIDRGEIAEGFYGLERFYCGAYVDPCLTRKEARERYIKDRRAQPAITKTLKRLESLGLVELVRRPRYVKKIRLTARGEILAGTRCGIAQAPATTIDRNGLTPGSGAKTRR